MLSSGFEALCDDTEPSRISLILFMFIQEVKSIWDIIIKTGYCGGCTTTLGWKKINHKCLSLDVAVNFVYFNATDSKIAEVILDKEICQGT
jgi:hypothetical protein